MSQGTEYDDSTVSNSETTVLIVEDETNVLETYELYLETEGYDIRTATNGGEAMVELEPGVDVVLLDRRMPGMSGDEVLEHIQDWDYDCRVAMVTAVDPDSDIVDMGFDDYLRKPITKDELIETVERFLLFDQYEELISEYHATTTTYATLMSVVDGDPENNEGIQELEERRERLRSEIDDVVSQFSDEEISEIFRQSPSNE